MNASKQIASTKNAIKGGGKGNKLAVILFSLALVTGGIFGAVGSVAGLTVNDSPVSDIDSTGTQTAEFTVESGDTVGNVVQVNLIGTTNTHDWSNANAEIVSGDGTIVAQDNGFSPGTLIVEYEIAQSDVDNENTVKIEVDGIETSTSGTDDYSLAEYDSSMINSTGTEVSSIDSGTYDYVEPVETFTIDSATASNEDVVSMETLETGYFGLFGDSVDSATVQNEFNLGVPAEAVETRSAQLELSDTEVANTYADSASDASSGEMMDVRASVENDPVPVFYQTANEDYEGTHAVYDDDSGLLTYNINSDEYDRSSILVESQSNNGYGVLGGFQAFGLDYFDLR